MIINIKKNTLYIYIIKVNEMATETLRNRKSAKVKLAAAAADNSDDDF